MSRRDKVIVYVRENLDGQFDPEQQPLIQLMDSVSLMQMIMWIDQELKVSLDLSNLSLEMFATVESLIQELNAIQPEA